MWSNNNNNNNTWLTLSRCLKLLSKFCWAFLASDRCCGRKRFSMKTQRQSAKLPCSLFLPSSPSLPSFLPPSLFCVPVSDPEGTWWVRHRCRSSCFQRWAPVGRRNRSAHSGSPVMMHDCWTCSTEERQYGKSSQLDRPTFYRPFVKHILPKQKLTNYSRNSTRQALICAILEDAVDVCDVWHYFQIKYII